MKHIILIAFMSTQIMASNWKCMARTKTYTYHSLGGSSTVLYNFVNKTVSTQTGSVIEFTAGNNINTFSTTNDRKSKKLVQSKCKSYGITLKPNELSCEYTVTKAGITSLLMKQYKLPKKIIGSMIDTMPDYRLAWVTIGKAAMETMFVSNESVLRDTGDDDLIFKVDSIYEDESSMIIFNESGVRKYSDHDVELLKYSDHGVELFINTYSKEFTAKFDNAVLNIKINGTCVIS